MIFLDLFKKQSKLDMYNVHGIKKSWTGIQNVPVHFFKEKICLFLSKNTDAMHKPVLSLSVAHHL